MPSEAPSTRRANKALDAANFFLADVRDGLGSYLAIYLPTEQKWDEARIGAVMSIAIAAGIVAQTPAGALVDAIRAKRLVVIGAALLVCCAPLILYLMRNTGRFNIAQGAIITAQGIGAALSTKLAGFVVVNAGYGAAFLVLGAVAAIGLVICWLALPETSSAFGADPSRQTKRAASAIAAE